MLAVVTGASGHVGANLVRALLAKGWRVRAVVRSDVRALEGLAVEHARGDLTEINSLRRAFEGADTVFHAAAHISITSADREHTERTNVEGAGNAAKAAREVGARRFVHFSSVHAFVHEPGQLVSEQSLRPHSAAAAAYDRSKVAGELRVRAEIERGLDAVIVNPSGVMGPHDYKPSRMGEVLVALASRKLPGLVAGGFDWVDVRDVALGAIAAAERGRTGENYILSGQWKSMREVALEVERVTGARAPRLVSPVWMARLGLPIAALQSKLTGNRPLFTSESLETVSRGAPCSHRKAAEELGYGARPLEETIADTLAWWNKAGKVPLGAP